MRICSFWFKGCPTNHMMHQALRSKGYLPICLAGLLQDTHRICSVWFKWRPANHTMHQATRINGWPTRGHQTLPGSILRSTEHARTNTLAARYLSDLLFLIQRVSHSISSGASRGRRNGRSPLNITVERPVFSRYVVWDSGAGAQENFVTGRQDRATGQQVRHRKAKLCNPVANLCHPVATCYQAPAPETATTAPCRPCSESVSFIRRS